MYRNRNTYLNPRFIKIQNPSQSQSSIIYIYKRVWSYCICTPISNQLQSTNTYFQNVLLLWLENLFCGIWLLIVSALLTSCHAKPTLASVFCSEKTLWRVLRTLVLVSLYYRTTPSHTLFLFVFAYFDLPRCLREYIKTYLTYCDNKRYWNCL